MRKHLHKATTMKSAVRHSWVFLAVLLISHQVDADVLSTFFDKYDKTLLPTFEKGEVLRIRSSLYVESFGNIEEANMEYQIVGYFHQYWHDPRLIGKLNRTLTLHGSDIDKLWVPDPFCYNARESNMMMPNEQIHSVVRIQPNGNIEHSRGVTLLASCVMNLHDFPLDTQTCFLKLGSYGHTAEEVVYEWHPRETEVLTGHSKMAQFEYKGSNLSSKIEKFSTANFSILTVTFFFHRRIGYFLIQVYFPNIFVVILSWIVFWMEKDDIGNRMALGITAILTIMFLLGSLNGNLPKVSYPKALDWYLLVSFIFVFLSLIECLIVFVVARNASNFKDKPVRFEKRTTPLSSRICSSVKTCLFGSSTQRRNPDKYNPNDQISKCKDDIELAHGMHETKANNFVMDDGILDQTTPRSKRMMKRAELIDNISRVLFPLTFVAYNIFYWTHY
ncbi:gamma-aminobutyric acid receptor subunit alpha-6-like isoform X1 [Montipora foliosa]|uniref:gamma-aminobutyric acid receptor subunit alpha-6-like isoform X1 n=2 Tax=Montipora foliosa TaxID=591990 RepID=UPI0035F1AE42